MGELSEGRSHSRATEDSRVEEWGPVCRGFQVLLPGGQRGSVADIRRGEDGVELVVATGLFARRLLTVREDEIEAVLPASAQVVVRAGNAAPPVRHTGGDLEAAGGIVRMPARDFSSTVLPGREAA